MDLSEAACLTASCDGWVERLFPAPDGPVLPTGSQQLSSNSSGFLCVCTSKARQHLNPRRWHTYARDEGKCVCVCRGVAEDERASIDRFQSDADGSRGELAKTSRCRLTRTEIPMKF